MTSKCSFMIEATVAIKKIKHDKTLDTIVRVVD